MPEGDSIRHVAARLAPVLEGAELRSMEAPFLQGPRPAIGTSIRSVDAVGKHVIIRFADGIHDGVGHLGPDLSDDEPDLDAALERMGHLCDDGVAVADALLDRRIACGVGNVFKSEICNACGVDPFVPVVELDPDHRVTYWCTRCQPPGAGGNAGSAADEDAAARDGAETAS